MKKTGNQLINFLKDLIAKGTAMIQQDQALNAPVASQTTAVTTSPLKHIVQPGESLWRIAEQYPEHMEPIDWPLIRDANLALLQENINKLSADSPWRKRQLGDLIHPKQELEIPIGSFIDEQSDDEEEIVKKKVKKKKTRKEEIQDKAIEVRNKVVEDTTDKEDASRLTPTYLTDLNEPGINISDTWSDFSKSARIFWKKRMDKLEKLKEEQKEIFDYDAAAKEAEEYIKTKKMGPNFKAMSDILAGQGVGNLETTIEEMTPEQKKAWDSYYARPQAHFWKGFYEEIGFDIDASEHYLTEGEERGVDTVFEIAGHILPYVAVGTVMAPMGIGSGTAGALTKFAPKFMSSTLGRFMPRVIASLGKKAIPTVGIMVERGVIGGTVAGIRQVTRAATNPDEFDVRDALKDIASSCGVHALWAGLSSGLGEPVRAGIAKALPEAWSHKAVTSTLANVIAATGKAAAVGPTLAALQVFFNYVANPEEYTAADAANDFITQALIFAGMELTFDLLDIAQARRRPLGNIIRASEVNSSRVYKRAKSEGYRELIIKPTREQYVVSHRDQVLKKYPSGKKGKEAAKNDGWHPVKNYEELLIRRREGIRAGGKHDYVARHMTYEESLHYKKTGEVPEGWQLTSKIDPSKGSRLLAQSLGARRRVALRKYGPDIEPATSEVKLLKAGERVPEGWHSTKILIHPDRPDAYILAEVVSGDARGNYVWYSIEKKSLSLGMLLEPGYLDFMLGRGFDPWHGPLDVFKATRFQMGHVPYILRYTVPSYFKPKAKGMRYLILRGFAGGEPTIHDMSPRAERARAREKMRKAGRSERDIRSMMMKNRLTDLRFKMRNFLRSLKKPKEFRGTEGIEGLGEESKITYRSRKSFSKDRSAYEEVAPEGPPTQRRTIKIKGQEYHIEEAQTVLRRMEPEEAAQLDVDVFSAWTHAQISGVTSWRENVTEALKVRGATSKQAQQFIERLGYITAEKETQKGEEAISEPVEEEAKKVPPAEHRFTGKREKTRWNGELLTSYSPNDTAKFDDITFKHWVKAQYYASKNWDQQVTAAMKVRGASEEETRQFINKLKSSKEEPAPSFKHLLTKPVQKLGSADIQKMMNATDNQQALARWLLEQKGLAPMAEMAVREYMTYTSTEVDSFIETAQATGVDKAQVTDAHQFNKVGSKYYNLSDPETNKALHRLGTAVVPGIRGQDADDVGLQYLMLLAGDMTQNEWNEMVDHLHESGRVKRERPEKQTTYKEKTAYYIIDRTGVVQGTVLTRREANQRKGTGYTIFKGTYKELQEHLKVEFEPTKVAIRNAKRNKKEASKKIITSPHNPEHLAQRSMAESTLAQHGQGSIEQAEKDLKLAQRYWEEKYNSSSKYELAINSAQNALSKAKQKLGIKETTETVETTETKTQKTTKTQTTKPQPGKVGGKMAEGEVVSTITGRKTTPFPKVDLSTNRKANNTAKRVDNWLIDNVIAEAEARGDDHSLRLFENIDRKNITQFDRDYAELYLFDKKLGMVPIIPSALRSPGGEEKEPTGEERPSGEEKPTGEERPTGEEEPTGEEKPTGEEEPTFTPEMVARMAAVGVISGESVEQIEIAGYELIPGPMTNTVYKELSGLIGDEKIDHLRNTGITARKRKAPTFKVGERVAWMHKDRLYAGSVVKIGVRRDNQLGMLVMIDPRFQSELRTGIHIKYNDPSIRKIDTTHEDGVYRYGEEGNKLLKELELKAGVRLLENYTDDKARNLVRFFESMYYRGFYMKHALSKNERASADAVKVYEAGQADAKKESDRIAKVKKGDIDSLVRGIVHRVTHNLTHTAQIKEAIKHGEDATLKQIEKSVKYAFAAMVLGPVKKAFTDDVAEQLVVWMAQPENLKSVVDKIHKHFTEGKAATKDSLRKVYEDAIIDIAIANPKVLKLLQATVQNSVKGNALLTLHEQIKDASVILLIGRIESGQYESNIQVYNEITSKENMEKLTERLYNQLKGEGAGEGEETVLPGGGVPGRSGVHSPHQGTSTGEVSGTEEGGDTGKGGVRKTKEGREGTSGRTTEGTKTTTGTGTGERGNIHSPGGVEKTTEKTEMLRRKAAEARARLKKKGLGGDESDLTDMPDEGPAKVDSAMLVDLSIIGAEYLVENPDTSYKDWSSMMLEEFGGELRFYLRNIYSRSQTIMDMSEKEIDEMVQKEPSGEEKPSGEEEPSGKKESTKKVATPTNYHITDTDQIDTRTVTQKIDDNIAAIKLLKQVEIENRHATKEEQAILVKYVGWGFAKEMFSSVKEGDAHHKRREELKELLDNVEWAAARSSADYAHYTSPEVVAAIYEALGQLGFEGGRILEPAAGIGHFFGLMPQEMKQASWLTGIEIDSISGRIATLLYPRANIQVMGYQDFGVPYDKTKLVNEDHFDLAISNVPFSEHYPFVDPRYSKLTSSLHNYFFLKAIDQVRPGGLVAFITSRHTLDSRTNKHRIFMAERAKFLGAVRLHNKTFKGIAETQVVTDIIFLQKREDYVPIKMLNENEKNWIDAGYVPVTLEESAGLSSDTMNVVMNQYYANHPEAVWGKPIVAKYGMYGSREYTVRPPGKDVALINILKEVLPKNVYETEVQKKEEETAKSFEPAPPHTLPGSHFLVDGKLYVAAVTEKGKLVQKEYSGPKKHIDRIFNFIKLRDVFDDLIKLELTSDDEAALQVARSDLNNIYDAFVKKFGRIISSKSNLAFGRDPAYLKLAGLEVVDPETRKITKAAIFTKRVLRKYTRAETAETAEEALYISLNETGRISLKRIEELTGLSKDKIIKELEGLIFDDPDDGWTMADVYLSGNVRDKLRKAEDAAKHDPRFKINVEALKKNQPKDLEPAEIQVNIGSPWINIEYYKEFIAELLEVSPSYITMGYEPLTGSWLLKLDRRHSTTRDDVTYGTKRMRAIKIIEKTLMGQPIKIHDTDNNKRRVLNEVETAAAIQKQALIKEKFAEWIWADEDRAEYLAGKYNEEQNYIKLPEYNGDHLTFPGMSPTITLEPHQKRAVYRALQGESVGLFHAVGAGKTFTMVATAMELKRLGIVKKGCMVVPNHLLAKTANEARQLYPGINLLALSNKDLLAPKRKLAISRIVTGHWDLVILPESAFTMIPINHKRTADFVYQELLKVERAIVRLRQLEGDDSAIVKEINKARVRLQKRLNKLLDSLTTMQDKGHFTFEETGIDALFIDESQSFKNLFYFTKMARVSGLGNVEGSDKALDMFLKTQYLRETRGNGAGIMFATGTPVTNSIAEVYTLQRYLNPDALEERNMQTFDGWANTFARAVPAIEINPTGTGFREYTRFVEFINVGEMIQMYRGFADIFTSEELYDKLKGTSRRVPDMVGGTWIVKVAEPSEYIQLYIEELEKREQAIKDGKVDREIDNMLNITTDGKLVATWGPARGLPTYPKDKIDIAAQTIYELWETHKKTRQAQVAFLDIGVPGAKKKEISEVSMPTFPVLEEVTKDNSYDTLRDKLVALGIPKKDVAFIHDYKKQEDLEQLYEDVNRGKIRVLIGSSGKMGTGMNIQERLIAVHHIDPHYRPDIIEQGDGRALRPGNTNDEVYCYAYVTQNTFDAYMWQTMERKQGFISTLQSADVSVRGMAGDIDDSALFIAKVKGKASDPIMEEYYSLVSKLKNLRLLERAYRSELIDITQKLTNNERNIKYSETIIERYEAWLKHRKETKGDKFKVTILGKEYTERKEGGEALLKVYDKINKLRVHLSNKLKSQGVSKEYVEEQLKERLKKDYILQQYSTTTKLQKDGVFLSELTVDIGTIAGYRIVIAHDERPGETYVRLISSEEVGEDLSRAIYYDPGRIQISESPRGVMASAEAVPGSYENRIEKLKEEIEYNEKEISKLEAEKAKGFEQAQEMQKVETRLREIEKQLGAGQGESLSGNEEADYAFEDLLERYQVVENAFINAYTDEGEMVDRPEADWEKVKGKRYDPSLTSISQVAGGLTWGVESGILEPGMVIVDLGGGKFDKGTKFLAEHGVNSHILDSYARPDEVEQVLEIINNRGGTVDAVALCNVLNVIKDKEERLDTLRFAYSLIPYGGQIIIQIHEADRSGKAGPGRTTKEKYSVQLRKKMSEYLEEIKEALPQGAVIENRRKDSKRNIFLVTKEAHCPWKAERSKEGRVGKFIGKVSYVYKSAVNYMDDKAQSLIKVAEKIRLAAVPWEMNKDELLEYLKGDSVDPHEISKLKIAQLLYGKRSKEYKEAKKTVNNLKKFARNYMKPAPKGEDYVVAEVSSQKMRKTAESLGVIINRKSAEHDYTDVGKRTIRVSKGDLVSMGLWYKVGHSILVQRSDSDDEAWPENDKVARGEWRKLSDASVWNESIRTPRSDAGDGYHQTEKYALLFDAYMTQNARFKKVAPGLYNKMEKLLEDAIPLIALFKEMNQTNINDLINDEVGFIYRKLRDKVASEKIVTGYQVVKYDPTRNTISFIQSPDFLLAHEPTVGDSVTINMNDMTSRITKGRKKNPQIYHHKWMMVDDNFEGFSLADSKRRSEWWENKIREMGIKIDRKKIGNLDYWKEVIIKITLGDEELLPEHYSTEKSEEEEQESSSNLRKVGIDFIRNIPREVNLLNKKYGIYVMEFLSKIDTPTRYAKLKKALGRTLLKIGQVVAVEMANIKNLPTLVHEAGHVIDFKLNNHSYPRSIKLRFPGVAVSETQLRDELKAASLVMRPVPGGVKNFNAYRRRHTELMADFYGLYLLDPELAESLAPTITACFIDKLESFPDIKEAIRELLQMRTDMDKDEQEMAKLEETLKKQLRIGDETAEQEFLNLVDSGAKDYLDTIRDVLVYGQRLLKTKISDMKMKSTRWREKIKDSRLEVLGAVAEKIDNIKTGESFASMEASLTPEERKILAEYNYYKELARQELNKFLENVHGEEYIKWVENYILHLYTGKKKNIKKFTSRWTKQVKSAKERQFPTYKEAMDAGLVPLTQNIADLNDMWAELNWHGAVNQQIIFQLKNIHNDEGLPIIMKPAQAPPDWPILHHPAIQRVYAKKDKKGNMHLWYGGAAIDPEAYRYLHQAFSRPFDSAFFNALEGFNAWAKYSRLSLSMFHFGNLGESFQAALATVTKPLRGLVLIGDYDETLGTGWKIPGTKHYITRTSLAGVRASESELMRNDALMSGLSIEPHSDAQVGRVNRGLMAAEARTRHVPGVKHITRAVRSGKNWYDRALWNRFHAGGKNYAYLAAVSGALKYASDKGIELTNEDVREVKEMFAELLNDAIGGQEWADKFWATPKVRAVLQFLFLAPDYTIANINIARKALQSIFGLGKYGAGGKYSKKRFVGKMARRFLWRYWISMMLNLFIWMNILNYAINKRFIWQNERGHRFNIDVTPVIKAMPWADKTDNRRYYAIPGKQAREVLRYAINPFEILGAKASPFVHAVIEQFTGHRLGEPGWAMPWLDEDLTWYQKGLLRVKGATYDQFVPFSLSGGNFAATFPMRKGMSWWKAQRGYEDAIKALVDPTLYGQLMPQENYFAIIEDISNAARLNGLDPDRLLKQANTQVRSSYYSKMWEAINKGNMEEADRIAIILFELGAEPENIQQSFHRRMGPLMGNLYTAWVKGDNEKVDAILEKLFALGATPEQIQLYIESRSQEEGEW